ncbi:MAG: hypothetical protein WD042_09980 [Phycisphaeraceae bacterium]
MPGPHWAILGLGIPAVLGLLLMLLAAGLTRWRGPAAAMAWPLACAGGLAVGAWAVNDWPTWPATDPDSRLFYLVLPAALLVELLGALPGVPRWIIWPLRGLIALALGRVLLHGSVYLVEQPFSEEQVWSAGRQGAWWLGIAAVVMLPWLALHWICMRAATPARSIPLSLAIVALGAGVLIFTSGSQSGGQMALSVMAALLGGWLGSFALRRGGSFAAAVGMSLVLIAGLLIIGRFFAQVTTPAALLVMLAPLAGLLAEVPMLHRRRSRPWLAGAVRIVAVAIPVSIAVVPNVVGFLHDVSTHTSDDGY